MTEPILRLLTRLSEAGSDAILTGEMARPFQGPLFERLLARRVIVEDAQLSEWDVCERCDCGLASRPIRAIHDRRFRAECPLDRRHDVELTEDELRVYRVEAAALASVISATAGFEGDSFQLLDGLWQLGALQSGRIVFLALELAALTGGTIAPMLRQATQGQDVAIMGPAIPPAAALQLSDARFHLVETLSVMRPVSGGFGVVIDPACLSPTSATATLRVRRGAAEVHWMGRSVILSRQIFPVFERLLEKAISRDQVASGSQVEGKTAREAKDLIRELRDAFKAAGYTDAESKDLIVTVRSRGYRLGVPASGIVADG